MVVGIVMLLWLATFHTSTIEGNEIQLGDSENKVTFKKERGKHS